MKTKTPVQDYEEICEVKVTKINGNYHARLFVSGKVFSEMACELREDIGYICREQLRWYDKLGGVSTYASDARDRQKNPTHTGRVWEIRKVG